MKQWEPISLNEIYDQILKTENDLNGELKNFWNLIKINPVKWMRKNMVKLEEDFG
jgi:hypothetical protein